MTALRLRAVTRTQGNNKALKEGTVRPRTCELEFIEVDPLISAFRRMVRGYELPLAVIETGGAAHASPLNGRVTFTSQPELIRSAGNTLYTSGTLGRYSKMLNAVIEGPGALYRDPHLEPVVEKGSVQLEQVSHD